MAPRSTGSVGRRNWRLPWASVFHCCGRYYLTCREPTRMSLSTSCIPCEGGLGGELDGGRGMSGSPWGNPEPRIEGILGWKVEKSLRWEERVCGGVGRGLSDSVSDLAVISGIPEECSPQAAMFEHVSISPAKAMSTLYSVSSVMGDFWM